MLLDADRAVRDAKGRSGGAATVTRCRACMFTDIAERRNNEISLLITTALLPAQVSNNA